MALLCLIKLNLSLEPGNDALICAVKDTNPDIWPANKSELSLSNIEFVENYLSNKWGIAQW